MATYTSNYAWAKPSGSDPVDISVLNGNLDSQDGIIHDAFLNMAAPFSESSTYTVGNIVLYGTKTYKCRVPVTTPGSWTGSTNWDEYKLSEGGLVAGDYVNITNGIINVQTDIGTYDNIRYEFTPTNGGYYVTVTIYINNIQRFQQSYHNDDMHTPIIIENLIRFWYGGDGYYWHYQPLIDSNEHPQNTDIRWYYNDMTVHEETFDVPQDDSTTLVTKGDLDDADGDIYAVMGQMGAKNLIPYPYYEDTEEDRGITWTNQSNGWVVATGTASADSAHNLSLRTVENGIYLPNGTYILNGCPSDGSDSTYYLEAVITKNSSAFRLGIDSGSGVEIEITGDDFSNDGAYVMIRGIVKNAYAIQSSLTFKPMLRLATDTDDTYQPYAKTNKQLTDEIANKVDKVTGKGLSTNDYTNTDKAEVAKVAGKADKTATATGETLSLVPTSEGRALLHTAYGMSTQSGTPTPSSPVDIDSAKANFTSTDGETTQNVTTDLTLRAIEVTSSDAYNLVRDGKYYIADTLDYSEDNGWSVTRRVKHLAIDPNDATVSNLGTNNQRFSVHLNQKYVNMFMSNRFVKSPFSLSMPFGEARVGGDSDFIVMGDNEKVFETLNDFKTWLTNNPAIFDLIYQTPTTETITTAQALALLGLKTYDESTTISSQAEPSCTVAVEYAKERLGALALTAYNMAKGNDIRITALEG